MARKKRGWLIFTIALLVYALLFLAATAFGLDFLADFLEDYEQSRPHIALNAYMDSLTADYVADRCGDLLGQIDHDLQSEEHCRQVLIESLSGKFTYAKKSGESTQTRHVYAIRCGSRLIGTMEMECAGEALGIFTAWEVTKDSFDLSYLLTEPVSITVPHNVTVLAFGNVVNDRYITQADIPYPLFQEFYSQYDLPHIRTYTVGPFLGPCTLTTRDEKGAQVTLTEETDLQQFLNNCSPDEEARLKALIDGFILHYMKFTTCADDDIYGNYQRLVPYMVPNGTLAQRMRDAFDGLYWVSDRHATLDDVTVGHYVSIGNGRYLCDVSYTFTGRTIQGVVQTTSHVKLILLATDDGLKAELMLNV